MLTVDRAAICVASSICRQWLFELNLILLLARLAPIGLVDAYPLTGLHPWTATWRCAQLGTRAPGLIEFIADAVDWTILNVTEIFF